MDSLKEFAKQELEKNFPENGIGNIVRTCVMELIEVYERQNHDASIGAICVDAFAKLAKHEPIGEKDPFKD